MPLTLSGLEGNIEINWSEVQNDLKYNAADFENLLFKIHLKRRKERTVIFNKNTLQFLSYGYHNTNDIRYYNEFLWFCNTSNLNVILKKECNDLFFKNLDSDGHHCHKFDLSEFNSLLKKNGYATNHSTLKGKKIGLIGVPVFFGKINKILKQKGADVKQIFIPAHPSKFMTLLFKNKPLIKFFSLIYNNSYYYETINNQTDDLVIYEQLKSKNFDIGFHKLNFIIRPNIFNAFKIGLINDHWGPLPFIRGKSTLAYNLLFGFPVIVTTHLVEKGIDTGKLIKFYQYNVDGIKKIKGIKTKVKRDLPNRAIDSIECIAASDFKFTGNQLSKGLTFYEIHPVLYKYIEKNILCNN